MDDIFALRSKQAAEVLSMSVDKLRNLRNRGLLEGTYIKDGPTFIRYSKKHLVEKALTLGNVTNMGRDTI